jgi:excisionase family DNA binding protein
MWITQRPGAVLGAVFGALIDHAAGMKSELADTPSSPRPVLTVEEVAHILGVSRWLVQQAARTGELPCIRLGRRILFPRVSIESLVSGHGLGT